MNATLARSDPRGHPPHRHRAVFMEARHQEAVPFTARAAARRGGMRRRSVRAGRWGGCRAVPAPVSEQASRDFGGTSSILIGSHPTIAFLLSGD